MALTTAQQVRLKIADTPKRVIEVRYGDGMETTFVMRDKNLVTASAYVSASIGWSATAATLNPTGAFTFAAPISANTGIKFDYFCTVFSDDEVDNFITVGGTVIGAAIEALGTLMFDAMRCSRWFASDGSSNDNTSSQSHARQMYDLLIQEQANEGTTAGGYGSWALNQDGWT